MPNRAGQANEVSFPVHALGQTLHLGVFAGRCEKSAVTYCCNSAPDETVGFDFECTLKPQFGRRAFLSFYELKLFIIPKKRTI